MEDRRAVGSKPKDNWKSRCREIFLPVLFSFAGAAAVPYAWQLNGALGYTNSLGAFLLFLALVFFFRKLFSHSFEGDKRRFLLPGVFGGVLALCMVFGSQLDLYGSVPFKSLPMWLAILTLTVLFGLTVRYGWEKLEQYLQKKSGKRTGEALKEKSLRTFLMTTGLIWLCYLPVFLAVYPGFFVYDAQDELLQVVTRNFSTHHPLFHVLLLGGILQFFHKLTGGYNLGIACYTVLQMSVMAGIFGYCVRRLKSRGLSKTGQVLLSLYFGLCPVLVMFSLCSAKDGLFAGMLLLMVLLLQELCRDSEDFFQSRGKLLAYGGASLLMMLLRHNGFYAFLVFIPILTLARKGQRLKVFFYQVVVAVTYLLLSSGLTAVLHADGSENQEMLTVPIAQMARVYQAEEERLSEEEKQILYRYLPEEALNQYTPKVTDGVKVHFDNEAFGADPGSFFGLWLTWGLKHPFTYLNAWMMTSYGFWYPDTVIDVYEGNTVFTFTYGDSSYFGYEVEEPGVRESRIPWLNEWYRKLSLEVFQQKIPVVSMLFSPGFLFWVMAFGTGFLLFAGESRRAVPFGILFLCYLTVLLGPTYLVRYVVYWWAAVPVLAFEVLNIHIKEPETGRYAGAGEFDKCR